MTQQKTSSQELYTLVNQYLQEVKDTLIKIEKKYFSLSPLFDTLNIYLDRIFFLLRKEKIYDLARRVKRLKKDLSIISHHKGYEPEVFQELFASLSKICKLSSDDIMVANVLKRKIFFFQDKVKKSLPEPPASYIHSEDTYKKLLMVADNGINFLVPIREKIWQKKIIRHAYRNYLKIKLKLDEVHTLHVFNSLAKGSREKRAEFRFAILISNEHGHKKSFLTDEVHGVIYLNPRLFAQKVQYLSIRSKTEAFIHLRGRKYFIKKLT